MVFAAGNHCLSQPLSGATVVNVTGISNFTIKGLGNISYDTSEEGAIKPSSVITCSCHQNKSGLLFYKSKNIHIESITIEDCGAEVVLHNPKTNFTMVSALIFYDSSDIEVMRTRMYRNMVHAEGIFGSFTISNSAFLRRIIRTNARILYKTNHPLDIGSNLSIENSWFLYGGYNKSQKNHEAGGLSVFVYRPKVSVLISNVKAMYNNGGNVAIHVNDYHENTSSVIIKNSTIAFGIASRGGGLDIRVEVRQIRQNGSIASINTSLNVVTVLKTVFMNNSASDQGGGVHINHSERSITDIIKRNISFIDCQFIGNSMINIQDNLEVGAAMQIYRTGIPETTSHIIFLFSFFLTNCIFKHNKLNTETKEGGILSFTSTSMVIIEDSNFTSNEGTAIFLLNSNLQFRGFIIFNNNSAVHGGALKFCQSSKMYLPAGHVHIDFINNSATSTGGAIEIGEHCPEAVPLCFFQPVYENNVSFSDLNVELRFINNTAILAGDVIYGGQVDRCYFITHHSNYNMSKYYKDNMYPSQKVFGRIIDLTQQHNLTLSTISSIPYGGCFCNTSEMDDIEALLCSNMTYPREVVPGQTFNIGVSAVGQRNGTVPISSLYFKFTNIEYRTGNATQLVFNNSFQIDQPHTRCNLLNCIVYSNENSAIFSLTIQQVSPAKKGYTHYEPPHLTVLIKECPWGFILANSPPYKCICDDLLSTFGISCSVDTQMVTVPGGRYYWLGCSSSNMSGCSGVSLADQCLLGYCKMTTISISEETLDHQCSNGREGVLCGNCKKSHSLALGTSRCLPMCPKYLFYIIIAVSVVSGLLLILFLIVCNFTISGGTINGLLFYTHVIHRNSDAFFPGSIGNTNIFRLFVAWLNFDLGFEVCFYKSMNQYQKMWIQCGFLFYLYSLEFAIIVLSRKYMFFTRVFGRNVVKVLATLFLICCAKMIDIGISSLEFARIRHYNGTNTFVWLIDGNLGYLTGKHIPLFMLGTILYSFVLVYTMTLLFIQCLQKRSNIFCLRWVERLRPFFEAYTSPCRVNYRFWPGFVFFIRLTLLTFHSVLRDKPTIKLHITTAACVMILVFAFVSPNGVYKRWPLNILEFSFFINLGIVSTLVATFCHLRELSGPHPSVFVYPSVAIVMVLFSCIISYHCLKQLLSYNCFQRLIQSAVTRRGRFRVKRYELEQEVEEAEPFLNEHMPPMHNFCRYRESLVGEH